MKKKRKLKKRGVSKKEKVRVEEQMTLEINPVVVEHRLTGAGTEDKPFLIKTLKDLKKVFSQDYLNQGYFFKQVADIDIKGGWKAKGIFEGSYDGNHHTINGLVDSLFLVVQSSSIKNIFLNEVKIVTSGNVIYEEKSIGALACLAVESDIYSCSVNGSILSKVQSSILKRCQVPRCGGIVGIIKGGEIHSCRMFGEVISITHDFASSILSRNGENSCGGIAGHVEYGDIIDCIADGLFKVQYSSSESTSCGGIVGDLIGGNVLHSIAKGSIISGDTFSFCSNGGIAGYVEGGSVTRCVVDADISSSSSFAHCGEVVGFVKSGEAEVNRITNTTKICDKTMATLIADDTTQKNGQIQDRVYFNKALYEYLGWDFEDIWEWSGEAPVLRG